MRLVDFAAKELGTIPPQVSHPYCSIWNNDSGGMTLEIGAKVNGNWWTETIGFDNDTDLVEYLVSGGDYDVCCDIYRSKE